MDERANPMQGMLQDLIEKSMEATGLPQYFVCGKRIVGLPINYLDFNRVPQKICIDCVWKALDFYLAERQKRMFAKGETDEK